MQSEFEGIAKLRRGVLILIIVPIIAIGAVFTVGVAIVSQFSSIFPPIPYASPPTSSPMPALTTDMEILSAIILVSIILVIVGYLYIRRGFKILADLGRNVRLGYTGTTLFFISLILFVVGVIIVIVSFAVAAFTATSAYNTTASGALTAISNALGNAFSGIEEGIVGGGIAVIIGWILQIVGNILIGIGFYEVGNEYNESTTKIGSILLLIGIVLDFLLLLPSDASILAAAIIFVSLILIYVGLGKINPMRPIMQPAPLFQQTYQPPTIQQPTIQQPSSIPQTTPQIYQVGQGVIRGDGLAFITLYTSAQAMITSVRVEGVTMNAVMVNPVILQPGQNAIVIKFDNVSQLIPGNSYTIVIGLKVGGVSTEVRAVATYYP